MIRVLVFGVTENPGGVESVIMNYYRNIDKEKIQFDFLCNTKIVAYEKEIKKLGGNIFRVTARSKSRKLYRNDMNRFFSENAKKYDAIWVNVCSLANIDYLKYAKKYGIKKRIIHAHNSQNMDSRMRGILHRINKLFLQKYCTDYWTCSNGSSNWFYTNKIKKHNKIVKITNAIDYSNFSKNDKIRKEYRKKFDLKNDTVVFGNIGRLHFTKNQIRLIEIFSEYKKNINPKCKLLLIGDGEDKEKILKKIDEEKLSDDVLLLGQRTDVNKIIQTFDIFVFPSLFEGLPLALIEAQVCGLPTAMSSTIDSEIVISNMTESFSLKDSNAHIANKINLLYKRCKNTNPSIDTKFDIKNKVDLFEQQFLANSNRKNLYICDTYYHLLISLIKQLNSTQKADIVISGESQNDSLLKDKKVFKKITESAIFDKVFLFDQTDNQKRIENGAFKHLKYYLLLKRLSRKHYDYDLKTYNQIFIYYDMTLIGKILNKQHIKYTLCEDGLDYFGKNYTNNKIRAIGKIYRNILYGYSECGESKYIEKIEVNNKKLVTLKDKRIVETPKKTMFKSLSQEQKNIILNLFDIQVEKIKKDTSILLTQPLFTDKYIKTEEQQIEIYEKLIKKYAPEKNIIIKKHPREKIDYAKYFPNYQIWDKPFPVEIINLMDMKKIDQAITISSTAINSLEMVENKIYLGWDWLYNYKDKK